MTTLIVTKEMIDASGYAEYFKNIYDNFPMGYSKFSETTNIKQFDEDDPSRRACINYLIETYLEYDLVEYDDIKEFEYDYGGVNLQNSKKDYKIEDIDKLIKCDVPFSFWYIQNHIVHSFYIRYSESGKRYIRAYKCTDSNSRGNDELYVNIGFRDNYFKHLNEYELDKLKEFVIMDKI